MTIPLWVLLGFAGWTLAILLGPIGVYRWCAILAGRMEVSAWRADDLQGSEWYRRAMRAHMNCIENLPVYAAVVVCATACGAKGVSLDALAVIFMAARICQTVTHIALSPTNRVASARFVFFLVQALCIIAMGALAALSALR